MRGSERVREREKGRKPRSSWTHLYSIVLSLSNRLFYQHVLSLSARKCTINSSPFIFFFLSSASPALSSPFLSLCLSVLSLHSHAQNHLLHHYLLSLIHRLRIRLARLIFTNQIAAKPPCLLCATFRPVRDTCFSVFWLFVISSLSLFKNQFKKKKLSSTIFAPQCGWRAYMCHSSFWLSHDPITK